MDSPEAAISALHVCEDRLASAIATAEFNRTLALDISVSDDGERCFARISIEHETASVQLGQTTTAYQHESIHDRRCEIEALTDPVDASEVDETGCVQPEPPDTLLDADTPPVTPWVPSNLDQQAEQSHILNDAADCKSEASHNVDGHGGPDGADSQQLTPTADVRPGDEEDRQPLLNSRYDDTTPSSPASSTQTRSSAKQASCELHSTPSPTHSPSRPEPAKGDTVTFLQERLESKAAEISGLREEVRRLRESRLCIDALPSGRASAEDDTVCISAAELAAMKKDMEEQERIIAGYGEANRSAAVQVKDLEARLKAKDAAMVEERAALERDLVRAVEAQKHRSADTADKLRRILELEAQLAGVKEQAAAKEAELRHALDIAKQEKKALEEHASAWERQAVQEGDQLVQQVRDEMQTVKAQYEEHVAGLQEKVEWHLQKQTSGETIMREQQAIIADLQTQLQDLPTVKAAQQHVAELRQQVLELQKGVSDSSWRKPASTRLHDKSSKHDHADVEALQAELKKTQAKAAEAQAAAEAQYRALEKQHHQLIMASAVGGDATTVAAQEEAHRLRQRVQTLQAILDAERGRRPGSGLAAAARSMRTHAESSSTTLGDMTNMPRHSEDGTGGARSSSGLTKQWVRLRQQLAEAKQTIMSKDSLVTKLHQQLQQGQQRRDQDMHVPEGQLGCLHRELQELRGQLARQAEAQAELHSDVRAATDARHRAEQACAESVRQAEAEAAELRLQVARLTAGQEASQVMVTAVQQASAAAAGALQEVRSQHAAELQRLSTANGSVVSAAAREAAALEARKGSERCLLLEGQLGHAAQRASALEQELQELRHSKVWAPSAREIVALENQVRDMSLQLSSQRQQWLAVTSSSPQPRAALAGMRGSPTARLSPAAQQMLSPSTMARGDALLLDNSTDVQAKIEYLQKQVDSVIEMAAALKQRRPERSEPASGAEASVRV